MLQKYQTDNEDGYAKLAEAVVISALYPVQNKDTKIYTQTLDINLRFADSPLIEHYADVFNFPVERIRDKIKEINLAEKLRLRQNELKRQLKIEQAQEAVRKRAQTHINAPRV